MVKKAPISPIVKSLIWVFAVIWLLVIGLDYINKHPGYYYALKYFRFTGLILQFVVLTTALVLSKKYIPKVFSFFERGIGVFLLGVVVSYMVIASNSGLVAFENETSDHFQFVGIVISSAIQILLILLLCMNAGNFIYRKFFSNYFNQLYLIDIGLGIVILMITMFFLAVFGVLNAYSLLIVLAIFMVISPITFYQSLSTALIKPFGLKKFSNASLCILFVLFTFLLINYISIHTPFPSGFDSRNYYVNISSLLASNGSLVSGYPPYNGSIFIATGLVLFEQNHVAHGMAFINIVLAILVAFTFARRILKFDEDTSILLVTMLAVTPAIVNQMFVELKVDFGLLYFQLLTIYCLIRAIERIKKDDLPRDSFTDIIKAYLPYAVLLGIFTGYGLGIKMINLFLLVVVFILIGWHKEQKIISFSVLAAAIALFLVGGIDTISGLRQYHLGAIYVALGSGAIAVVTMGYAFLKSRVLVLRRIVFAFLVGFCSLLIFSPWAVKNYNDTKSLNPKTMLMGGSTGPDISLGKIKKNYNKSIKDK